MLYEVITACIPLEDAVLSKQLAEAVSHIQGNIPEVELDEVADGKSVESIPADINVRNYSFTLVDNAVYYREDSRMNKVELPKATEDRVVITSYSIHYTKLYDVP